MPAEPLKLTQEQVIAAVAEFSAKLGLTLPVKVQLIVRDLATEIRIEAKVEEVK